MLSKSAQKNDLEKLSFYYSFLDAAWFDIIKVKYFWGHCELPVQQKSMIKHVVAGRSSPDSGVFWFPHPHGV